MRLFHGPGVDWSRRVLAEPGGTPAAARIVAMVIYLELRLNKSSMQYVLLCAPLDSRDAGIRFQPFEERPLSLRSAVLKAPTERVTAAADGRSVIER
jgi:hypothetical protein